MHRDAGGARRGTVFLVVDPPEATGEPDRRVNGYWDTHPDPVDGGEIETLPEGLSLESAIAWARERSSRVLVRNDDSLYPLPTGRYLWAGDAACPPDVEPMA